jgi:hypothetical protein
MSDGCGAPDQSLPANVNAEKEIVISGTVLHGDAPLSPAYVRLSDHNGDFVGEVPVGAEGQFRFFAAPGTWNIRALSAKGNGDAVISAAGPGLHKVDVTVG